MTAGRAFGLLLAALCMAAVGYGVSYWYPLPRQIAVPHNDTITTEPQMALTRIEAQGRLEPDTGTRVVGALPGEEIVQLDVHVGQTVRKDDVLAVLESYELRTAERVLAEHQLEKARQQYEAEKRLGELREQLADVARQQAQSRAKEIPPEESIRVGRKRLDLAKARLAKLEQLREDPQTRDAIAEAELEQQQLLIQQIEVELEHEEAKRLAAEEAARLARDAADLDVAMAQATQENLEKASPLPVLQQSVELARLAEEASLVRAPCDGTVLEVYSRQGERIANTPILQLGDLRRMVCIAEIHEANLKDLEVETASESAEDGKLVPARDYRVTLRSAALEQDLAGSIVEVGRLIGAPALRDPNPLAQSDLRTVKVRIALDDASSEAARRFVNLQVNVTIHLEDPETATP
jgi:HlyD family secretion protein